MDSFTLLLRLKIVYKGTNICSHPTRAPQSLRRTKAYITIPNRSKTIEDQQFNISSWEKREFLTKKVRI